MAKFLYLSTAGSDDPTRAAMPFIFANGAVEGGHEAGIALAGEAVYLMKQVIADAVVPVGWPPLKEQLPKAVQSGVQFYV